jgi:hypothetical protein
MSGLPAAIRFPVPEPHFVFIRDRARNSGLTSVRWYDDETLFAADFSAKALYRVKPFAERPIEAQIRTLDGGGQPTQTDLMDLRGDVLVVTNFYRGEVGFYSVGHDTLRFERVIQPPTHPKKPRRSLRSLFRRTPRKPAAGRKIHGAVFVPRHRDLLWVSFCDAGEKGIEIVTLDGRPVHSLSTGEQAQDVAFVEHGSVTYAIQAGRTDHMSLGRPNDTTMYATLYVYRLPPDLHAQPPELVASARFEGHLDALRSWRGSVYAANQNDSCVDQFTWIPERNEIVLAHRLGGFDMPHGLDIRHDGLMAVTNYGPANDMRFIQLT